MASFRQRDHRQLRPFVSTADGSVTLVKDGGDEDDGVAVLGGTCSLAQVGAGVIFAFMLASLGYILTGDNVRSFWWWIGLVCGATLGVHATRGASTSTGTPEGDESGSLDREGRQKLKAGDAMPMVRTARGKAERKKRAVSAETWLTSALL